MCKYSTISQILCNLLSAHTFIYFRFLAATGRTYGRPIHGQHEIVGTSYDSSNVEWKAMEGLFIHKSNFNPKANFLHDASEL